MKNQITRRQLLKGSVALAALALAQRPLSAFGLAEPAAGEQVVPFLDQQPAGKMLRWQQLTQWLTPTTDVFAVSHYGVPTVDLNQWSLEVAGLVRSPATFTLGQLKARKRKTVIATLECSGNGSDPTFMGAIGNVRWTGTPLGPLLKECGLADKGSEIVFFGADEKIEKIRDREYAQNFARSLARADALRDDVLLAWEMNGQPLTTEHGAPLRLIVPGWFGIAWVKWLTRLEVLDRRYMSKYMAREYVTIRGEEHAGHTIWRETSVGPIDVKSITARVVRRPDGTLRVSGAAWTDGTPLKAVELKIDDSAWLSVELDRTNRAKHAWTFWHFDWKNAPAGEHKLVSRAIDAEGRVQPAADDPAIQLKRTYWEANQQHPRTIKL